MDKDASKMFISGVLMSAAMPVNVTGNFSWHCFTNLMCSIEARPAPPTVLRRNTSRPGYSYLPLAAACMVAGTGQDRMELVG